MLINKSSFASALSQARNGEYSFNYEKKLFLDTPKCLSNAYSIQKEVTGTKSVSAWKVGYIDGFNHPVGAPIYKRDIHNNHSTIRAKSSFLIECEVGYKLKNTIIKREHEYSSSEIRECIESVVPVIELINSRINNVNDLDEFVKIADNQLNSGLIIGDELRDWETFQPEMCNIQLSKNDIIKRTHNGKINIEKPETLIAKFVNAIQNHCGGLKAGDIIITGARTKLLSVSSNDKIKATFNQLGAVNATFY